MNRKLFFALGLLALNAAPSFAQINWDNAPAIPGPEGTRTTTTHKVGIGLTTVPTDVDLHVNTAEYMNDPGTSDVNLRLTRNMIGINMGGPHTPGNLIEAIVNFQMTTTKGFVLTRAFNMGIGTDVPASRLNVHNGNITMTNDNDLVDRQITANTTKGTLHLITGNLGPYIEMGGVNASYFQGQMNFVNSDIPSGKFEFLKHSSGGYTSQMTIRNDGKVVIGNVPVTAPAIDHDYKLYVQDGILTERVKVAFHSDYVNWSDFVFAKDYELMPLSDVETYIEKNKHLPDIPSTEDVMKNGLDLATMDARLLQKVEELTLYVIEQQKQINELKKQIHKN
jgi:hypothetical protein